LEKKDDFWNWLSVSKGIASATKEQTKSQNNTQQASKAAPSTYATAEERAQTQKYIVRQSSVSSALRLAEINGNKKAILAEILKDARVIEDWVMGKEIPGVQEVISDFSDMDDDIPL
jgi:hypothetical protein